MCVCPEAEITFLTPRYTEHFSTGQSIPYEPLPNLDLDSSV